MTSDGAQTVVELADCGTAGAQSYRPDRSFSVNSESSEVSAPLLPDVTFSVQNAYSMAAGTSRESQPLLGGSIREEKEETNTWTGKLLLL